MIARSSQNLLLTAGLHRLMHYDVQIKR